tara:strand:+ start:592 stop:1194 length:603 start_codon:yes stop_codon:yes gene_type:complete
MKNLITVLVVLLSTTVMFSQKAKVQEGNIKNLKGVSQYDLVFDYSDVQIPKFDSEEDFLKDKMDKRDEKEAGTGEEFKKDWFDDREEQYEPKFIESFNKRFDDGQVKVGMNLGSEYIMKVHTTLLYSGYNVGVMRKNAKLDAIISVYKKDNPTELLYSVKYTKAEGGGAMGYDYDTGYRISECYAKLAKTWAKVILKKAK